MNVVLGLCLIKQKASKAYFKVKANASKKNCFGVLIHMALKGKIESQILKQRPKLLCY